MKTSGIGGQAVMEGVMMKNADYYAVAVRKQDGEIVIKKEEHKSFTKNKKILSLPIIRGVFNFIDSLVLGMSTLTYSASFFMEDEEEGAAKPKKEKSPQREEKENKIFMGLTVAFSVVLAVGIFMLLPYFLSSLLRKMTDSNVIVTIMEGVLRLVIFGAYILLISKMEDIQRVFMYHGAEHKCINCVEHGLDLTVENVRKSSRLHKRCGTSFLFVVMIISIIFFLFIQVESPLWRIILRILLVPVIAGVSYEFLMLAGRSESQIMEVLSKPGMALQKVTTSEPDDSMIQVAIASVEAVFDWKAFESKNFGKVYEEEPTVEESHEPEGNPT